MHSAAVRDILATVPADAFASDAHGHIAATITTLHLDQQPVDPTIVANDLRRQGLLERVGGGPFIVELYNLAPSLTAGAKHAEIVLTDWRNWRQVQIADEITFASLIGGDITGHIQELLDLSMHTGVDELALEDVRAALDDTLIEHPSLLVRDDGRHLLYENATNMVQSEPTHGKSMLAFITATEVIDDNGHILYLDYEDSLPRIARRMVSLGCSIDELEQHFHYKRMGPVSPGALAKLPRLATDLGVRLIVIDGLAEALASQGYDEDRAGDVVAWWCTVARPLAATGACVLILDHVTKSKEARGRWARGSGAKLGALDGAAYTIEPIESFSRAKSGRFKLVISKDRNGSVGAEGETAGIVQIDPVDNGNAISWKTSAEGTGEWQGPTDCMALIRRLFTEGGRDVEFGKSAVPTQLKAQFGSSFRRDTIYQALERLVIEGELSARTGPRNGRYYRLAGDLDDDTAEMF